MAGQGARVDTGKAADTLRGQVLVQGHVALPVRRNAAGLVDDEAPHLDALRLHVLGVDAVVTGQRVGEDEDLAGVGGIGEHLLVAGHRGGEDDLAVAAAHGPERPAGEGGAVFQDEDSASFHSLSLSLCILFRCILRSGFSNSPDVLLRVLPFLQILLQHVSSSRFAAFTP